MKIGEAICQEFCRDVLVLSGLEAQPTSSRETEVKYSDREELKCHLDICYFTGLMERMVQAGYCCTQVQKDLQSSTCTAWFEPASPKNI